MLKEPKIIASMTSFPAAVGFAARALRSVLNQSVKPDKVVLYLTASQFPGGKIPAELTALKKEYKNFEVRFYEENIRSYTKLIPALKDFPDDIIITFDDDILYPRGVIAALLRHHKKYPRAVIGNRIRRARFGADGRLIPHLKWKVYKSLRFFYLSTRPRLVNHITGVAGALYPPHIFPKEVFDSKTFMEIAPSVDDVWFWLMAVKNGVGTAPVPFGRGSVHLEDMTKPMEITLKSVNIYSGTDVNLVATEKILEKYPDILEKLKDKNAD
ncbi:MAG: glycosyltransferase [Rickettsiales bacterium]|jgi:hypothetical protein|nr:glycosyltransferase [Rickettsiales bacterium]